MKKLLSLLLVFCLILSGAQVFTYAENPPAKPSSDMGTPPDGFGASPEGDMPPEGMGTPPEGMGGMGGQGGMQGGRGNHGNMSGAGNDMRGMRR